MKFWDYEKRPYRPVEMKTVATKNLDGLVHMEMPEPDVFTDSLGRIWYAGTAALRLSLPPDPTVEKTIPPHFWHPANARKHENDRHEAQKRETEDAEAELRAYKRRDLEMVR